AGKLCPSLSSQCPLTSRPDWSHRYMPGARCSAISTTFATRPLSDFVVEWGGKQVASIRKGFEGATRRAGLKDVTLHTIRHSSAVAMVSAGIPITQVAQYLGHSNTAITFSTYGRFAPDHLTEAAEVLDFVKLRAKG
ncbi:tyrosine-type recombinase/integrase, partial [Paracoccus yeei]